MPLAHFEPDKQQIGRFSHVFSFYLPSQHLDSPRCTSKQCFEDDDNLACELEATQYFFVWALFWVLFWVLFTYFFWTQNLTRTWGELLSMPTDNNLPRLLLVMSSNCLQRNVHNRLQPRAMGKSILRDDTLLCASGGFGGIVKSLECLERWARGTATGQRGEGGHRLEGGSLASASYNRLLHCICICICIFICICICICICAFYL